MARMSFGGGPVEETIVSPHVLRQDAGVQQMTRTLVVLWYANGHPTFLVLLNPHPASRLLHLLDLLLEEHDGSVGHLLRADELAAVGVSAAVFACVQLGLEGLDLAADVLTGARAGATAPALGDGHGSDGDFLADFTALVDGAGRA